jgi:transposase InsO family protein
MPPAGDSLRVVPAHTWPFARLGPEHRFIYAGRPQTYGCVERVQRTILDECWKPIFARYLTTAATPTAHHRQRPGKAKMCTK